MSDCETAELVVRDSKPKNDPLDNPDMSKAIHKFSSAATSYLKTLPPGTLPIPPILKLCITTPRITPNRRAINFVQDISGFDKEKSQQVLLLRQELLHLRKKGLDMPAAVAQLTQRINDMILSQNNPTRPTAQATQNSSQSHKHNEDISKKRKIENERDRSPERVPKISRTATESSGISLPDSEAMEVNTVQNQSSFGETNAESNESSLKDNGEYSPQYSPTSPQYSPSSPPIQPESPIKKRKRNEEEPDDFNTSEEPEDNNNNTTQPKQARTESPKAPETTETISTFPDTTKSPHTPDTDNTNT